MGSLPVDEIMQPSSLPVLAVLVLLFMGRRGRVAAILLLVPLIVLSLPIVAGPLLSSLDVPAVPLPPPGPAPGAVVILSADVDRAAPPAPADIGPLTLDRERAGAILAKRTGLPVLVTGGLVTAPPPVGQMMRASMQNDFGITVRWTEDASATTWENARFSVPMLRADGITRIYLVTHAWHMRRALLAFERAGMDAVPVPVRLDPPPRWVVAEFLPRTNAWSASYFALHEWIGLLWYKLRG